MDRQLESPLLLIPDARYKPLSSKDTYEALSNFVQNLAPSCPALSQLERLTDALGVDVGVIQQSEGDAREKKRRDEKMAAKAERRRIREAEAAAQEQEDLEAQVEGLEGEEGEEAGEGEEGEEEEGEKGEAEGVEEGAVGFDDDEEDMGDRGDVEYGDVEQDEDEDEPDNADDALKMDTEEWCVYLSRTTGVMS